MANGRTFSFSEPSIDRGRKTDVAVSINGTEIGSALLRTEWTTGQIPIPGEVLVRGENTIAFDCAAASGKRPPKVTWNAFNIAP